MHHQLRSILYACTTSALALGVVSCATLGRNAKIVGDDLKEFTGWGDDAEKSPEKMQELSALTPINVPDKSQLYAEEDIEWIPEDPNAVVESLEEIWEKGPTDDWFESYDEAMRAARKEGKPVLLWFTNSRSNAASKSLDRELFSKAEFKSWADENVIRLRVDSNVIDDDLKRKDRKRDYVAKLRKQYKVMGAPVVLVLSPRGTQFGKYRGYKTGDAVFFFGKLKSGHRNAMADYANWRQEYEAKGYRMWHDTKGRKVFAKPVSLKDGVLGLREPDGKRGKTKLSKLSKEDRVWVQEYVAKKAKR